MLNLNFTNSSLYMLFLYFLYYPVGYVFYNLIKKENDKLQLIHKTLIYITLGFSTLNVVLFLIGLFNINGYYILLVSFIFYIYIIFIDKKNKNIFFINKDDLYDSFLFLTFFIYINYLIGYHKWPPVGDVITHGAQSSLLNYNSKILTTYFPHSNSLIKYPLGFSVFSSFISDLFKIYPGESVFILGGNIIILIPIIFYIITFKYTNSKFYSTLSFLSIYIIYFPNLQTFFTGYFFNGSYPSLFGYLIFFSTFLLYDEPNLTYNINNYNLGRVINIVINHLSLLITYPNYILSLLIFNILKQKSDINKKIYNLINKNLIYILLLIIFFIILYLNNMFLVFYNIFDFHKNLSFDGYNIKYLLMNLYPKEQYNVIYYLIFIIISLYINIYFYIKKIYTNINYISLIIIIFIIFSFIDPLYLIFKFSLPIRLIVIYSGLSWINLSTFTNHIINEKYDKRHLVINYFNKQSKYSLKKVLYVLIIFILLFGNVFSLTNHFQLVTDNNKYAINGINYGWFLTRTEKENNVFNSLFWLNDNINEHDLILNDLSFTSYSLFSLSFKNITFMRGIGSQYKYTADEYSELFSVWGHPNNESNVDYVLNKYNIKYIYITPEYGYKNRTSKKYLSLPFSKQDYILLFDKYNFLESKYNDNGYKVYAFVPKNK